VERAAATAHTRAQVQLCGVRGGGGGAHRPGPVACCITLKPCARAQVQLCGARGGGGGAHRPGPAAAAGHLGPRSRPRRPPAASWPCTWPGARTAPIWTRRPPPACARWPARTRRAPSVACSRSRRGACRRRRRRRMQMAALPGRSSRRGRGRLREPPARSGRCARARCSGWSAPAATRRCASGAMRRAGAGAGPGPAAQLIRSSGGGGVAWRSRTTQYVFRRMQLRCRACILLAPGRSQGLKRLPQSLWQRASGCAFVRLLPSPYTSAKDQCGRRRSFS